MHGAAWLRCANDSAPPKATPEHGAWELAEWIALCRRCATGQHGARR
ncbi:hypothetical protein [Aestuariicoccus sp. MJ-SS9]|nr:hypothetical protein [Aestuariicoccus sp. MJ-SS9]MDU8913380.1 hypothetical protein [Aestuariicoccus sp. MJ-SS9]